KVFRCTHSIRTAPLTRCIRHLGSNLWNLSPDKMSQYNSPPGTESCHVAYLYRRGLERLLTLQMEPHHLSLRCIIKKARCIGGRRLNEVPYGCKDKGCNGSKDKGCNKSAEGTSRHL